MSLTFGDSTSHSSNWDGGQVPPRTLRLINHPRFNICPVPKGCPPAPPPHHPLWRWVLGFIPLFSIRPFSPANTPSPTDKTSILPCPSEEETLFSPLWQKPSEAKMGTASQDAWDPAGVPPSPPPYTFLPPSGSSFPRFCSLFYF